MTRRFLHRHLGHRVVVHTRDDQSIRGVLTGVHVDGLVLEAPEYLGEAKPSEVDGRAFVPASNFGWAQLLGSAA